MAGCGVGVFDCGVVARREEKREGQLPRGPV